jgi:hypothetical protein
MASQPPGWYPDPQDPSILRYRYGDVWTPDKTRPVTSWPPQTQRRPRPGNQLGVIALVLSALAALVTAAVLFTGHPTYALNTPTNSQSITCASAWEHFSDTGSHPTPGEVAARLPTTQDLLTVGTGCSQAIAGRDHLTVGLLVLSGILGVAAVAVHLSGRRPRQVGGAPGQ